MYITRLDIDNFGPFMDRPLTGISPGLTVIHGPNEAGKSALRAFIRSVFFGYIRKNEKGYDFYYYPPARGGAAEGSVGLRMSSGAAYTVHRREGPYHGPVIVTGGHAPGGENENGATSGRPRRLEPGTGLGGAEFLEDLLGRVGPELYQNVFSVSLSELQSLESLNAPQIRDRIYSVGLGLSRVSLPDAVAKLEQDVKTLRGPRSGRIRDTEKELAEARAELERVRAEAGRYDAVAARLREVEQEIAQHTEGLDELRSRLNRQKQLIDLRPHWERMNELERQLAEVPVHPTYPPTGERLLDDILRALADIARQISAGDIKQQKYNQEMQVVPIVEPFLQRKVPIRRLISETQHYSKAVEDLPIVMRELHDEQTKMTREMEMLGPGWAEGNVAGMQWPADFIVSMENSGKALTEAKHELDRQTGALTLRTEEHTQSYEEYKRAASSRDALKEVPQESVEALEAKGEKLRRMRTALADASAIESERREAERRLAEGLARVQPEAVNSFIFGSVWMAVGIILLGVSAIGWGFWQRELAGAVPGAFTVIAGAVMLVRARLTGQGMKIVLRRPQVVESNDVVKKQTEELKAKLDAIAAEVKQLAAEAKLSGQPTARQIEEWLAANDRAMGRRRTYDALAAQVHDAEERVRAADQHRQAVAAAQAQAHAAHTAAAQAWQQVLQAGALRTDLDPSQAGQVYGGIRSAQNQQKLVAQLRDRVAKMQATIQDIELRLASVLQAAGLPPATPGQATPAMLDLAQRYTEHERAVERADRIEQEMLNWIVGKANLEREQSQLEAERKALHGTAKVADDSEFRAAAADVAKRKDLVEKLEDLKQSHPMLVNEVGQKYREALEKVKLEDLQAKLQRIEDQARDLQSRLSALHTELGQLKEQKRAMEESDRVADLHVKVNELEERLREDARQWAVLAIARDMLDTTRLQFQQERQPALLQSASRYFRALTVGRYSGVQAVVGDDRLEVVGPEDRRKGVTDLSRGTAEQLYLAMRFALIEEYSRNAEPLPVIMDDVLVNFDPDRARAACSTVLGLSAQFQVLFLTCHPQTVEYFRDMADGGGQKGDASNGRSFSVVELPAPVR